MLPFPLYIHSIITKTIRFKIIIKRQKLTNFGQKSSESKFFKNSLSISPFLILEFDYLKEPKKEEKLDFYPLRLIMRYFVRRWKT